MDIAFQEHDRFSKVREALFGDDEGFRAFQNALLLNPRLGDVIQGTGGARKVRWNDPTRGKGKRSGIRVIYAYVEAPAYILLLFAYDKNIPDLTPDQKRRIHILVDEFRKELA